MKRRALIGSVTSLIEISCAGCLLSGTGSDTDCDGDRIFNSLTIINKKQDPVEMNVEIERNGETVADTTVTAPAAVDGREDPKEIIDIIDDKSGSFTVKCSTNQDEVIIDVTEQAGRKKYILIIYIGEQGDLTALTNQDR
jgi:hypothetical protein